MTDATIREPSAPTLRSTVVAISSLEELNEAFADILRDPLGAGVAHSAAQASVLGNVRAAYINQSRLPIPSSTSAARGALVALLAAAQRLGGFTVACAGDLRSEAGPGLSAERDARGLLNPMRLFTDDMDLGLYRIAAVEQRLRGTVADEALDAAVRDGALVLVSVDEDVDWETWMETFAR